MELMPSLVNLIALLAILTGLAIGAWWVIGLYGVASREEEKEAPEEDLPAHLVEKLLGVPPVLTLFILFILVYSIVYVLYIWLGGITY